MDWTASAQALVLDLIDAGKLDEHLFDRLTDYAEDRARHDGHAMVRWESVAYIARHWGLL